MSIVAGGVVVDAAAGELCLLVVRNCCYWCMLCILGDDAAVFSGSVLLPNVLFILLAV